MNRMHVIWKLSRTELLCLLRSTKMIILAVFIVFLNIQVIVPLRELSVQMGGKLSVFEPFLAIGNSGLVLLILPLLFITMMADFPREGESQYFCQIRCSKRLWTAGQILYAAEASVIMVVFVFVVTVLLSLDFTEWNPDYSYGITRYVTAFPERAGDYAAQLIPENLYNQISLGKAVFHTAMLQALYFFLLALILLICALIGRKLTGLLLDGALILLGTITCATRMAYMWILPMGHTIPWLHYTEYESRMILPMSVSYIYFGILNIVLLTAAIVVSKRYQVV